MTNTIKPEEIFNRVNESIFQAQDDGIKPIDWAKRKVSYYDDAIRERKEHNFSASEDEHLRDIWAAVVQHFANQNG